MVTSSSTVSGCLPPMNELQRPVSKPSNTICKCTGGHKHQDTVSNAKCRAVQIL
jgi:hypothetical protein